MQVLMNLRQGRLELQWEGRAGHLAVVPRRANLREPTEDKCRRTMYTWIVERRRFAHTCVDSCGFVLLHPRLVEVVKDLGASRRVKS